MNPNINTREQPTARLTVQIGYEDILSAVYSWKQEELEGLIVDIQAIIQEHSEARAKVRELLYSDTSHSNPSDLPYTDEELDAVRWQALAEKYHLLETPLPRHKASLAEMMSILPTDARAPSDEEVDGILMGAKLERLGELKQ